MSSGSSCFYAMNECEIMIGCENHLYVTASKWKAPVHIITPHSSRSVHEQPDCHRKDDPRFT